ncbi:MAG TPA: hypothetical protein VM101_13595, partial [Flavitalea sp.]|nr:hypothetical protein [Flavitalea sp.]
MSRYMLLFATMIITGTTAVCQVKLPRLIRDSMVLQRDTKFRLWGWAAKNEKVSIRFNGQRASTKAGTDGKWTIWLPSMKA